MKNLIIACLLIISVLTAGCGGGGGSSTKPTVIVTAPTISDVATESTSTHTVATISGIGFGSPVSSSYVTYDGKQYSTNDWYDNKIVVTVPFSTVDPFKFRVVVNNVTSNPPLNATNNMRIFSISPSSGNPGTDVTISGQGFGASQVLGAYFVTFHNPSQQSDTPYPQAIISNWSDTSITCKVPTDSKLLQSGSGQVVVTVWKSSTNYVSNSTFNLILPSITYIDPTTDNIGATIKIYGGGFGSSQNTSQGTSQIRIGGNYAQVVDWADSIIEVRVPDFNTAGQKTIEMTINNRTISNTSFSVAAPELTSWSPSGNSVISNNQTFSIYGRHFGIKEDYTNIFRSISVTATNNLTSTQKTYNIDPNSANWSGQIISFPWPDENTNLVNKTAVVTINI
ncbi:MAG TPA: IPT/TIG domain-containing protein, partial [Candidatus Rifleibacterium sp.]|nr:IPT/TIG domain-containing protein [Candidatus Rifleibacterium sp.]